jgi:hypothetical protein
LLGTYHDRAIDRITTHTTATHWIEGLMEGFLKQSTAANVTILMIDATSHVTGATGLAAGLTIYATKAAGTPATITPTVTELDATNVKGVYKLALTTGHTDTLGELQLHITATGADPTDLKWQISPAIPGDMVAFADAILDRDMATGTDSGSSSVRTVRQALRVLRNKIDVSSGTMTVTKENDSTASWTAVVTTTPGADPVTGIDPA